MSIPFRRRRFFLPLAGVLVTGAVVVIIGGSAIAQVPGVPGVPGTPVGKTFSYGAKFVCGLVPAGGVPLDPQHVRPGFPTELPLKPANYATDINVHNPQTRATVLWKKAVLTGWVVPLPIAVGGVQTSEPEQQFEGGKYLTVQLAPDGAFGIDCNDINTKLLPPGQPLTASFITGFVVINSPVQLDVTAVYTSERQDAPVIHCLQSDGQVVPATPDATGHLKCPPGPNGATGTVGIAASQAGTGLTMDVEAVTPTMVTFKFKDDPNNPPD